MELTKDLPTLTGTEKQVAWANKIRNCFWHGASYLDGSNDVEEVEKVNKVFTETKAKFWIDNRNCRSVDNLVKQFEIEDKAVEEKKEVWHKVEINIQNIKHETERAVLIAFPHSSNFDGFKFWFPKKLVREGFHSYSLLLSVPSDMDITAKRTSDKTRAVLAEKKVSVDDLIEAFNGEKDYTPEEIVVVPDVEEIKHTPEKLEITEVNADASLVK